MNPSIKSINNLLPFFRGRLPGQLIIQYSSFCNADCPQCGMRRSNKTQRFTMPKEKAKSLIDDAAANGVKSMSFTGGEPLLFLNDIIELISYANRAGIPFVRTGTNGFLFCNATSSGFTDKVEAIAEKLASTDIYTFWISLDSFDPKTHESMRGLKGVVKGIEQALPIFHRYGIYPSVNLGINRAIGGESSQPFLSSMTAAEFEASFQLAFEQFYQFAIDLGFTIVNACYPMSSSALQEASPDLNHSLYGAASSDAVISFSRPEKALIFKALFATIPKYRGKLQIFSPRCSLFALINKFTENSPPLFPCRGGTDFFFVNSEKEEIYPCGYLEKSCGALPDLKRRPSKNNNCDLCEWECFRDPSDCMGPFAEIFKTPVKLLNKMRKNPQFFKLLVEDLRYYRACNFFNGRQPPQFKKMQRFQVNPVNWQDNC